MCTKSRARPSETEDVSHQFIRMTRREGNVALIVDEWGTWFEVEKGSNPGFLYQQNTMRDALVAAISLNTFNRHSKRVKMANIAQAVNVYIATHRTRI